MLASYFCCKQRGDPLSFAKKVRVLKLLIITFHFCSTLTRFRAVFLSLLNLITLWLRLILLSPLVWGNWAGVGVIKWFKWFILRFKQLVSGLAWIILYISRLGILVSLLGTFIPFSARKQGTQFDLPKIYQKLVDYLFNYFWANSPKLRTAAQLWEKSYSEACCWLFCLLNCVVLNVLKR